MRIAVCLLVALLASAPVLADVCPVGTVAMSTLALTGAAYTSLPAQKSEIYPTSGYALSGFSYTISNSITLAIVSGSSLLGSGSIILPASPSDGQPLTLECPKGVTLISLSPSSGQTVSGFSMTSCAANTPYRLKYSGVNATWYPN